MPRDDGADEDRVCAEIARRERDLVELLQTLVRFDTTTHAVGDAPRDEAALQAMLAERLRAAGAAVDVWEPDMSAPWPGTRWCRTASRSPAGRSWPRGSPGAGGGRTLLLNGHVDVVSVEPRDRWRARPVRRPWSRTARCTAAAPAT